MGRSITTVDVVAELDACGSSVAQRNTFAPTPDRNLCPGDPGLVPLLGHRHQLH